MTCNVCKEARVRHIRFCMFIASRTDGEAVTDGTARVDIIQIRLVRRGDRTSIELAASGATGVPLLNKALVKQKDGDYIDECTSVRRWLRDCGDTYDRTKTSDILKLTIILVLVCILFFLNHFSISF